jgi:probable phosphoglycerate mutase
MAIYLIRHGETASNAARVVQKPETPLSPRGLEQAQRLARRLADVGIAAILASDLARAVMTAESLAATTGLPVTFEPLLQERNFGAIRGTPYADLAARGVELFGSGYVPPGGESWEAFHARVDRAWQAVEVAAAEAPGHLAIVTHGLVCHSIVSRRLGQELDANAAAAFPNTALTILDGPPWRIDLLGCTAHLAGLDAPDGISGL